MPRIAKGLLALALAAAAGATPAWAQGRGREEKRPEGKHEGAPKVTVELALSAAREVLGKQGYEVVRVEVEGDRQIIYYRAGNQGRGRGHGPPARMVIRRTEERIVLEDAPDGVRLEIGIRLGIKL